MQRFFVHSLVIAVIHLFFIAFPFNHIEAQIKPGVYMAEYYVNMKWNPVRKAYETSLRVDEASGFKLDDEGIHFKKGDNGKWLYNTWTYQGELTLKREVASDWYLDDRGQKVVIDYDNKTLLYYYDYDRVAKVYRTMTQYRKLSRIDDEEDSESDERFRIDANFFAVYDESTSKWSDWKEGFNSFVMNYNSNGDVLHITGKGKQVVYRRMSDYVKKSSTSGGDSYQLVELMDEDGKNCRLQIYDDASKGIKLMYNKYIIQFVKSLHD